MTELQQQIKIKVISDSVKLELELEIPLVAVEMLPIIIEPILKLKQKQED